MSDLEVASELPEISGKRLTEVAAAVRKMSYEERVRGGGGENLASSPHASLNRPTRLVEKSHQSLGKHMRKRHEKTEGKRTSRLVKWS